MGPGGRQVLLMLHLLIDGVGQPNA
jgi:hypothetical protein